MRILQRKRIIVVVGHYGSGKTEFSVNAALFLKRQGMKTALVDLDIANPYFRSREQKELLEQNGVAIFGNAYGHEITAEIPAITAAARGPLEDSDCHVVVDAGGDDSGARILNQFRKYFTGDDSEILCVINRNRKETSDVAGAKAHIQRIEAEIHLPVTGIINNTHMLRLTKAEDLMEGFLLCQQVSEATGIPIQATCCVEQLCGQVKALAEERKLSMELFPIQLYMRPTWLDVSLD